MVAGNPARDMATVGGYAITARGDADNQVGFGHGYSFRQNGAATRSSATRPAPIRLSLIHI